MSGADDDFLRKDSTRNGESFFRISPAPFPLRLAELNPFFFRYPQRTNKSPDRTSSSAAAGFRSTRQVARQFPRMPAEPVAHSHQAAFGSRGSLRRSHGLPTASEQPGEILHQFVRDLFARPEGGDGHAKNVFAFTAKARQIDHRERTGVAGVQVPAVAWPVGITVRAGECLRVFLWVLAGLDPTELF